MNIKTIKELIDYIGIFGGKPAGRIKRESGSYIEFSFDEYKKNTLYLSAYLAKKKKLNKGDMVAIYSENRPEWLMAYFGIVYSGFWAVPLDARLTDLEVKNLIFDCDAKIIFLSKGLYDNLS